jgi:hypothetical protein
MIVNKRKFSSAVKNSLIVFMMIRIKRFTLNFFDLQLFIPNIGERLPWFSNFFHEIFKRNDKDRTIVDYQSVLC